MNNEEFQKKADSGRKFIDTLASLKLTVLLLVLSMLLVLLGTLMLGLGIVLKSGF